MKVISGINEILTDFVSLLFPKVCIHCGISLVHQEEHLCTNCILDLPKTNYHLTDNNFLFQKFAYEEKVVAAASFLHFQKRGIAQSIIHHLKYREMPEVGMIMGRMYGEDLLRADWPIDYIVPVPLHKTKLQSRGYNQSDHVALGIGEVIQAPVITDLVIRTRRTSTQTQKSKVERWQNIRSVYHVEDNKMVKGKNILIVDDVLTTGATIGELASLLIKSGANDIYIATLAAGQ